MNRKDWGAEGVHWSGIPGESIERLDDTSDYGRTEPIFEGDMEAALHVARNGFPFVLYDETDDREQWVVTVYETERDALEALADGEGYGFIFDVRQFPTDGLADGANGIGYRAPITTLAERNA